MFQQELQNFEFSEKEALIYVAALELGPSTIQEIAQKTGLVRTTVYNLTRSLAEKGLMTEHYEGKRRFSVCQLSDKLLRIIRLEKKELEEQKKRLQAILPELKGLIDVSRKRTKMRFFKGKPGIRKMQEDILRIKDLHSIKEFVPLDYAWRLFPPHRRDHRHRMLKILSQTRRKIIYTSNKLLPKPSKSKIVESRYINPQKLHLSCEINICGDTMSVVMFGSRPKGVIMEAQEMVETFHSLFYLAWKVARKLT